MTIQIFETNVFPDSTYFTTGDVEPAVSDETRAIVIINGEGTRRSWGRPQVTSTIVYQSDDFVSIHVGFSHKHRGGQFWRHYSINGEIVQVSWAKLDDSLRAEILEAYDKKAPGWAKSPGKLRKDYIKPGQTKMVTFKAVAAETMTSLYDGRTCYEIGKRLAEAVDRRAGQDNGWGDAVHGGGWYSHPSIDKVKKLLIDGNLVPDKKLEGVKAVAIIKCEISGRIVSFPNGKIASTYLTPVEVVETVSL
jgi:hypothetical protein